MEDMIYDGKAKSVLTSGNDNEVIIYFKDDTTAFNGVKHEIINSKGILNNKISTLLFKYLEDKGINTHFIKQIDERKMLTKKLKIIPLEFILRNYTAGSMAKRLGLAKGVKLDPPVLEISYKNDELNDPLLNDDHALALGIVSEVDLKACYEKTLEINKYLQALFNKFGITLVDFKVEYGLDEAGNILLGDEFSPDNARLWNDKQESLDKDVFRQDLGDLTTTYTYIYDLLNNELGV